MFAANAVARGTRRPSCASHAAKRDLDTEFVALVTWAPLHVSISMDERRSSGTREGVMDGRKPLAKVEGRRRMRLSGVTVAYRGTPDLDDWVAYIANGSTSRKLILADHASERKVKGLLTRCQRLTRKEIEKIAKD
jgi:hypothetical protein